MSETRPSAPRQGAAGTRDCGERADLINMEEAEPAVKEGPISASWEDRSEGVPINVPTMSRTNEAQPCCLRSWQKRGQGRGRQYGAKARTRASRAQIRDSLEVIVVTIHGRHRACPGHSRRRARRERRSKGHSATDGVIIPGSIVPPAVASGRRRRTRTHPVTSGTVSHRRGRSLSRPRGVSAVTTTSSVRRAAAAETMPAPTNVSRCRAHLRKRRARQPSWKTMLPYRTDWIIKSA